MKYRHVSRLSPDTPRKINCRGKWLEVGRETRVMGILNVTPDSFSDGGKYVSVRSAVDRARILAEQGADILDVGGESTRPGATPVSLEEELERVIPVIEKLVKVLDIPVSVDTYKAEVARQALEAGAHIINDVWGFKKDPDMAKVAASYEAPAILMHNRTDMQYQRLIPDMLADLRESIRLAREAGVRDEQILLDPGIGFAKTVQHNMTVMNHLSDIASLGYPVVLGTSRKSMIWKTLDSRPDDVVEGTAATVALGIAQGCHIIRVHDVREMKRVAVMTDAMLRIHEHEGR